MSQGGPVKLAKESEKLTRLWESHGPRREPDTRPETELTGPNPDDFPDGGFQA